MKKSIFSILLLFAVAIPLAAPSIAVKEEPIQIPTYSIVNIERPFNGLADYGSISYHEALVINGIENPLYPVFDDIDAAIAEVRRIAPNYCRVLESKYDLKEAYNLDYRSFQNLDLQFDVARAARSEARVQSLDSASTQALEDTLANEQFLFEPFLDIYENKAANEEIKDYIASTRFPNAKRLAYMLPYTCPFVEEYFNGRDATETMAAQTFNEAAATPYAIWNATNPNPSYPCYSSDCTNFASQILVAGGINMHDCYPDENSGWWHRAIGTINPGSHATSRTWRVANDFVRFMGTHGNVYSTFNDLATRVRKGDFISYDRSRDGSWNHVGYVTATYGYKDEDQNTIPYRDFSVAQHTRNYHLRVSSPDNGWEEVGNANFAIVRRNATIP